jgi:hypothetical protein
MSEPANPGTPDTGTAAPEGSEPQPRKIAPIPDKKGAAPADSRPRNSDGTFAATGERVDDGGLPDILKETDSVEDDYDRAKVTLDGGEPQKIQPLKHKTTKTRAKDVLRAEKPEGAPASDAPIPEDALATPPEGTEPAVEDPSAPDEPLVVKGKLVIAGHEYRDVAHLDQAVRSMAGMISAESKRSATRAEVAKSNYEAAIAWQGQTNALRSEVDALRAEIASLKGEAPPSGSSAGQPSNGSPRSAANGAVASQVAKATGDTTEHVLKTIDWDKYKQIREKYDPETALAYMVQEALTAQQARFDARIDEMTRPAKERDSIMSEGGKIGDQMDGMAEWKYDGSADPIYPELADPDAYDEIAQVIVQLHKQGAPLSLFQKPEGVHTAILTWRDWRNRNRRPWSKSSPNPTIPTPDPHAAAAASVRAAAGAGALVAGRNAPVRPAPATEGRGADIVRGITESSKPTEFGWSR